MAIPPCIRGAFHVVEQREGGQLAAVYARPEFNPMRPIYRDVLHAEAPMLKILRPLDCPPLWVDTRK